MLNIFSYFAHIIQSSTINQHHTSSSQTHLQILNYQIEHPLPKPKPKTPFENLLQFLSTHYLATIIIDWRTGIFPATLDWLLHMTAYEVKPRCRLTDPNEFPMSFSIKIVGDATLGLLT